MKKVWWILVVSCVFGGMYGSLSRLGGMALYYPDINLREYLWIADDPIGISVNGSLIYRLSNEVGFEPYASIYSTDWKSAFGYAVIHQDIFSLGVFVNDQPESEDYLSYYPDANLVNTPTYPAGNNPNDYNTITSLDRKPWFDIILGSQKIPFSPYIGLSLTAAAYSTNYEHIPNPVDPTKALIHGEESAFLWKIRTGATVDILKPFVIDASVGVWIPSFTIQTKTTMTEIQNYKNEEKHISEGNFGVEVRVFPKWKLSPRLEWKSMLAYRYLNLNSTHTVTMDLNGDGDFVDAGELKSKNTHPYSVQQIEVGTGITYSEGNLLAFGSLNNLTLLSSEEWFTVNQSTGTDVYMDKENGSRTQNYTILNGGIELGLKKWLSLRMGVANWYHLETTTTSSFTYAGTTETARNTLTEFQLDTMFLPQLGLSIHFGGFSIDWMISDAFIWTVIGQGRLPYLISGNNLFDNFSFIASLRYNF